MTDIIEFGKRVVEAATRLFQSDIIDPSANDLASPPLDDAYRRKAHARAVRSREAIDDMLKACGWGAHVPYAGNHHGPEWCGIFAGKCYREAGLDPQWLATWFPSTYRLNRWATYRPFDAKHVNKKPLLGPYRQAIKVDGKLPDGFVMPAGAIVVVGDGTPSEGDHITIGVRVTATGIFTISGNGGGNGPDGKHREGVVEREFPFVASSGYRVLWIYVAAPSDVLG
jgi:hypothetical protein